tara:strand:- start:82 stop:279 length:198 start_codon:yes stop_codon:yes gene_type:complete
MSIIEKRNWLESKGIVFWSVKNNDGTFSALKIVGAEQTKGNKKYKDYKTAIEQTENNYFKHLYYE